MGKNKIIFHKSKFLFENLSSSSEKYVLPRQMQLGLIIIIKIILNSFSLLILSWELMVIIINSFA